jgi:hypothetical protein
MTLNELLDLKLEGLDAGERLSALRTGGYLGRHADHRI